MYIIPLLCLAVGQNYVAPASNQNSDVSSLETEMEELESELQAIESQISAMENMNSNNNNNHNNNNNNNNHNNLDDMGFPNTDVNLLPSDAQQEQSALPSQTNNENENSNQLVDSNSQPNIDTSIYPESPNINYEHVINHVKKHYKRNKFVIWIILGVAAVLALIACPSWVACCIGCYCHRRRQKARLEEKFSYDATSDSDEDSSKQASDSLVRKLTMVSRKRRDTQQRKGAYEPLKKEES